MMNTTFFSSPLYLLFFSLCTSPTLAQPILNEFNKIITSDITEGSNFGQSVSINNGLIAVGAPGFFVDPKDVIPVSPGFVYVFDQLTNDLVFTLTALDSQPRASFGESVAMNDDYIVVGAPDDHCENTNMDCGAVYIFDATTGVQLHKLTQESGFSTLSFGNSVAIEGDTVVVGVPRESNQFGQNAGSVYLFNAPSGQQLHHFSPGDLIDNDIFGYSVAISNGIIAIGSPFSDTAANNAGAVYLYDAATATQLDKLLPPNPTVSARFGNAVDIENDLVLIGATDPNINRPDTRGAYIYSAATGNLVHELIPTNIAVDDRFGVAVSIKNGYAAVGAWASNQAIFQGGTVHLFETNAGQEIAQFIASDPTVNASLGFSVDLSSGQLIAGAYRDRETADEAGAAYQFLLPGECAADINNDGMLDFFDVSSFLSAFNAADPIADINQDGLFDFFDVSIFINEYNAGCP